MNKRIQYVSAVSALCIIVVGLLVVLTQPRPIAYGQYTNLEGFPQYYYTNFTISGADDSTVLVIDLSIDSTVSFVDCYLWQQIYSTTLEDFEMYFNITEAADLDVDGTINAASTYGSSYTGPSHITRTIWDGNYVFVFWIVPSAPPLGWSASLTLRTSTLQTQSTFG